MTYERPDLEDDEYIAWNGEVRKKANPDSFNGDQEWEDQGFHSRGVSITEGTQRPSNLQPVKKRSTVSRGAIEPTPDGFTYSPWSRPSKEPQRPPEINYTRKRKRKP